MAIDSVDKVVGRRRAKISTMIQRKRKFQVVVTPECPMLHENQEESKRRSLYSNVEKFLLILRAFLWWWSTSKTAGV